MSHKENMCIGLSIYAPMNGETVALESVPDPVFDGICLVVQIFLYVDHLAGCRLDLQKAPHPVPDRIHDSHVLTSCSRLSGFGTGSTHTGLS